METHMPYGITQCYLPPGTAENPAFTPAEADTRFSDPRRMQGRVDLCYVLCWIKLSRVACDYASAVCPVVVCPSVCLSVTSCTVPKWLN